MWKQCWDVCLFFIGAASRRMNQQGKEEPEKEWRCVGIRPPSNKGQFVELKDNDEVRVVSLTIALLVMSPLVSVASLLFHGRTQCSMGAKGQWQGMLPTLQSASEFFSPCHKAYCAGASSSAQLIEKHQINLAAMGLSQLSLNKTAQARWSGCFPTAYEATEKSNYCTSSEKFSTENHTLEW